MKSDLLTTGPLPGSGDSRISVDKVKHRETTVSGVKWNLLSQVVNLTLLFGVGIVLMRLLTPAEFGLMGMVNVFSGFLVVLSNFGLASSLIQMKMIDDTDKSTVFWFSLLFSALLAALLTFGSPLIAAFYREPRLIEIASVLSVVFVLQALGTIHNALLRKEMEFKKLFIANSAAAVIACALSLTAAFYGMGVWSLVIQQLAMALSTAILLWFLSDFRPKWIFSRVHLQKHLKFGLPLLGSNTVNYWIGSGDNLLIGKFLGVQVLGFYSRAYSMVTLPTRRLNIVFTSVLFPSFSQIKDDIERVKHIYLRASRVIAFFILPAMGLLVVVGKPLISVLAGDAWLPMTEILQLLAAVAAVKCLTFLSSNVLLSQGRSDLDFKINILSGVFILSAFLVGAQFSMVAVGIAYLIAVLVMVVPIWYLAGAVTQCSVKEIFLNFLPLIIISIVLTVAGAMTLQALPQYNDFLKIVIACVEFAVGWMIMTKVFYNRSFEDVRVLVISSFLKRRGNRDGAKHKVS